MLLARIMNFVSRMGYYLLIAFSLSTAACIFTCVSPAFRQEPEVFQAMPAYNNTRCSKMEDGNSSSDSNMVAIKICNDRAVGWRKASVHMRMVECSFGLHFSIWKSGCLLLVNLIRLAHRSIFSSFLCFLFQFLVQNTLRSKERG